MAQPTGSVIHRQARLADLPAIVSLWSEAMAVHASTDPRFPLASDADQKFESYVGEALQDPSVFLFVTEIGSRVVAYCLARIAHHPPIFSSRSYGYINDLMVTAAFRRQGIGTGLFQTTVAAIRSKGIRNLEVSFVPQNEMSSSFWRKLGFTTRLETLRLELDAI